MKKPTSIYWFLIPSALLVLGDEWIKFLALTKFPSESDVTSNFFALAVHKNLGLAFDLPFRVWFIVLISIVLGYFLLEIAYKNWKTHPAITFSSLLIVTGALGNLYDRIVYGFTVDYLIFFGRSAINLSDLLIIFGVIFLLVSSRKTKSQTESLTNG